MRFFYQSLISFALVALFVPYTTGIFAEEPRLESRSYSCLNSTHCASSGTKNKSCEPKDDDNVHVSTTWSHRSQIDLDDLEDLPLTSKVLVTECIDAGIDLSQPPDGKADSVCTTGDSTQDKLLFCGNANHPNPICDHFTLLKENSKAQYSLERSPTYGVYYLIDGVYKKSTGQLIDVGSNGKPTVQKVEWESYTKENLHRRFLGWYFVQGSTVTPTQIPLDAGNPTISPGVGGQQQAVLTFPTFIADPTSDPIDAEPCEAQQYDPYGRVFDMKTLEPIPRQNILLKQKDATGQFTREEAQKNNQYGLAQNPFPSGNDGEYLFFVVDGDYALEPVNLTNYTHPGLDQESSLLPNARAIYSDFYFNNSPPILQRGAIQHRDIPLMPTGEGQTYDLAILYEDWILNIDGTSEYRGKVSHPFAELLIETCRENESTEVCNNPVTFTRTNGGPDKFGDFSIILDQKNLQTGEYYKRSFSKFDLTTANLTSISNIRSTIATIFNKIVKLLQPQEVVAQSESTGKANLQPIVSYIEGYAYGSDGIIMPNAQVNLMVSISQIPVYQTFANETGYYKITSEFLPKTEYTIQYVSETTQPNSPNIFTTSQFLKQNESFISAEKVDPYLVTTTAADPRKNITPTFVPPQTVSAFPSQNNSVESSVTEPTIIPESATSNNSMVLIGAILLLLVATAGTLIGVYLYRKKIQGNEEIE